MTKASQLALCTNNDCPAADTCTLYVSLNVAGRNQSYFKPKFDPKRVPPCRFYGESKPFGKL